MMPRLSLLQRAGSDVLTLIQWSEWTAGSSSRRPYRHLAIPFTLTRDAFHTSEIVYAQQRSNKSEVYMANSPQQRVSQRQTSFGMMQPEAGVHALPARLPNQPFEQPWTSVIPRALFLAGSPTGPYTRGMGTPRRPTEASAVPGILAICNMTTLRCWECDLGRAICLGTFEGA